MLLFVERLEGSRCGRLLDKADKAKATVLLGVRVHDDLHARHLPKRGKKLSQLGLLDAVGQSADVERVREGLGAARAAGRLHWRPVCVGSFAVVLLVHGVVLAVGGGRRHSGSGGTTPVAGGYIPDVV